MARGSQPFHTGGGWRVSPLHFTLLAASLLALGIAIWLTRGRGGEMSRFAGAIFVMAFDSIPVSGWLIAAWGFGSLVRKGLRLDAAELGPIDLGLGVPALLWLDHALGAAGLLQLGGSAGGWLLLCVGWLAAMLSLRERLAAQSLSLRIGGVSSLALIAAVPALTVMFIAATSAPGWLWATEAGGYDVLEYHLQMPREWLTLGSITPQLHNAYSFAPSYVEAAYYHLAVLLDPLAQRPGNGALEAATACQMLHAALMIWAAREVTLLAGRHVSHWMALAAGAMTLSVPWVVVTGSMAYNEAPLIGLLALCWRLSSAEPRAWRSLVLIGFLAGIACGAKLTAAGLVVAPIGMLLLIHTPTARWWRAALGCAAGGLIALGPYALRNWAALDGGNPLFPFATGLLGTAHWTAEQAQRWNDAHGPHGTGAERLVALWQMAFVHAQWAWLWFAAAPACALAWLGQSNRTARRDALIVLAVQLIFWLTLTHLQSRFLLPCVVPLVVLIVLGLEALVPRFLATACSVSIIVPAAMGAWTMMIFNGQGRGMPATFIDGEVFRTGVSQPPLDRRLESDLIAANSDIYLNLRTRPDQGLYLLGDATPFYILRPVVWHTTWDTSPLGEIIRAHGDDEQAWAAALIERGISLVLVNYAELDRLGRRDEWYDPIFREVDVLGFFERHGRALAAWPGGRVLYELNAAGQ
ncbi:MAG: hypothetical protein IT430_15000 [Phycisphaerales bacterium]|nr:hypothetical protein [Phycisphaerales bacterium]